MPDVVDHPHSAHAATRAPKPWADVIILALVAGVFGTILFQASESVRDFRPMVSVSLEPSALPLYALRSLGRGLASYLVSLAVTLVFATWAARSARSERILIPLFDILQGIPVLGFLPGLVLGMVALFPGSNLGLELACILMIFTGQACTTVR
jgi:NitT/TauT family transport system permease protein